MPKYNDSAGKFDRKDLTFITYFVNIKLEFLYN